MERSWVRRALQERLSLWSVAFILGVVALLVIVAALQYRWTTQITDAAEARVGASIESLMVDWHSDFYREFAVFCVALQVGPDSGEHDDWVAWRDRYGRWREASRYPNFVQNLYIWETSAVPKPRLLRITPGASAPEPAAPVSDLQPLLARLQARSANLRIALHAWDLEGESDSSSTGSRALGSALSGWQFDPNIPALVHPIVHQSLPGDLRARPRNHAVDWVVVVFSVPVMQEQILPALSVRYFNESRYGGFSAALLGEGRPPALIYASDSGAAATAESSADAVLNIFGPPPQSTEGNLWEAVKRANSVQPGGWRSILGPVWFPVIRYGPADEPWKLVLRHRSGPLDDVVLRVRRDNLLISSFVLLLLAASMTLVVLSAWRARKIAQLQMDFVASVSHELRTPLAALLSAGENIQDGVVQDPRRLRQYGSIVTSQAHLLIGLVDQILLFAATRSGRRNYYPVPLLVPELIELAVRNIDANPQMKFTVEKSVAPNLAPVLADRDAVLQCLRNLLANAMKYSGSSRWLRIAAESASLKGRRAVVIAVEDHGIGIGAAELPRIFRPFYRSPRVQAAQIHGTGLGLAVARRIAEDMGGELSVRSQLGAGSSFFLTLPAAPNDADPPPLPEPESEVVA